MGLSKYGPCSICFDRSQNIVFYLVSNGEFPWVRCLLSFIVICFIENLLKEKKEHKYIVRTDLLRNEGSNNCDLYITNHSVKIVYHE